MGLVESVGEISFSVELLKKAFWGLVSEPHQLCLLSLAV